MGVCTNGWAQTPALPSGVPDPLAYTASAQPPASDRPVTGRHGMVVTAQHLASEVGAKILAQGGNAADAAVAVGYALAVVYPAAGNIGGGGFMVLKPRQGEAVFIDFREKAPLASTATMFQDTNGQVVPALSTAGWKAVAIPGTVAGLEYVREHWGHLSRTKLMEPAIHLAREGFVLEEGDVALLRPFEKEFGADPVVSKIFLRPDGQSFQPGDRLVQTDLSSTLSEISRHGADVFYKGSIARRVVDAGKRSGGILQMADFSRYRPRIMPPLTCSYRGFHIDTAPPPSGGGIALCEMLTILSGYDLGAEGLHSATALRQQIEAMRHAYSDRRDLGDPAFVSNPVDHLLDPGYAVQVREGLPKSGAVKSETLTAGSPAPSTTAPSPAADIETLDREKHETTHFSVMDSSGMAVSTTYTLNGWFGARVMAPGTGFFLNDEMDDFSAKPGAPNMFGIIGSQANAIQPGKTPLSSMAPTIVSRDGKTVMVIGSPGGSRIPTIVLSVITGVIDYHLNIQQAIDLPRFHEQWEPSTIEVEKDAVDSAVAKTLSEQGYVFHDHAAWGIPEGIVTGILAPSRNERMLLSGGADHRHPGGSAVGE
ncbi:gamma-glutamyltransferase [Acetobacter sp.]|jgi:gamma-glutamyltranspeptidase/glutathione hydrolase|uniref:gamma-glutamyltransferase n=1 Tax=Acetobacter sp. TaxID=440 RepID=UPI0025BA1933|nr:gamma-glutamyltransferase [Acetobacter sp.]MCH4090801.1 gamma-glutamyltransferase [Acetobacter sp.]MCI1300483.1 gamma-glutamyltransferase [Acetobacter sp.]MCI1316315.1 gamma-glutamyltransferase [Acetobacter sp.]